MKLNGELFKRNKKTQGTNGHSMLLDISTALKKFKSTTWQVSVWKNNLDFNCSPLLSVRHNTLTVENWKACTVSTIQLIGCRDYFAKSGFKLLKIFWKCVEELRRCRGGRETFEHFNVSNILNILLLKNREECRELPIEVLHDLRYWTEPWPPLLSMMLITTMKTMMLIMMTNQLVMTELLFLV